MQKYITAIISTLITAFMIGLVLWNVQHGRSVKEVVMPNGASVKFDDKKEQKNSSSVDSGSEIRAKETSGNLKNHLKNNVGSVRRLKHYNTDSEKSIEQHTEGNQSPAVNSGRDTTINYVNK